MYKYTLFLCLGILSMGVFGQSYSTTIGARFGNHLGLTVNQWLGDKLTGEAIVESDLENSGRAHLLLRKHSNILWRRVNLYAGIGPHLGWGQPVEGEELLTQTTYGGTGVLGVEFTLFQLNISFDYLPVYQKGKENLQGYKHNGALSVRYVIEQADGKNRRAKQKARRKQNRHKRKAQKGRERFKL